METILNFLLEYGWSGVLMIIIVVIFWAGSKYIVNNTKNGLEEVGKNLTNELSKQNRELINNVTEQNKDLTDKVLHQQDLLINHIINKEANHDQMIIENTTGDLAEEINDSIEKIRIEHNAKRIYIIKFHNSGQDLSGIPFVHYSMIYEKIDKGITPILNFCQNLPFGSISYIVRQIAHNENNQITCSIADIEQNCPAFYDLIKQDEIENNIFIGMFNKDNVQIGMIGLEFAKIKNVNINKLNIETAELTSKINLRYKYVK